MFVSNGAFQFQHLSLLKNGKSAAYGDGVEDKVIFIDEVEANERANKIGAAVDADVLAGLVFEGLYDGGQVVVFHFEVAVGEGCFAAAKGNLAMIGDQLRQRVPGVVGL